MNISHAPSFLSQFIYQIQIDATIYKKPSVLSLF